MFIAIGLLGIRPPVTLGDRVQVAIGLLAFAGFVLWVGLVLLRSIGRSSPTRRRHGQFVLGWMLAGWLVGSAFGVCLVDNHHYWIGEADIGMAWFGLLIGWIIGMFHGGVVLLVWPDKTQDQAGKPVPPQDTPP